MRVDRLWTVKQAGRWGLIAGAAAALLWPAHALAPDALRPWFLLALAATLLCGASMTAFTLVDLVLVRRDRSVLPARLFDLSFGLLLAIPSGTALAGLLG